MCGIIGLVTNNLTTYKYNTNLINDINIGLIGLQHRGQDAVGICNDTSVVKKIGLVKNLFQNMEYVEEMRASLGGNMLMGHVRYLTSGSDNESAIQPLSATVTNGNTLHKVKMCHNGNILNINDLKEAIDIHSNDNHNESDSALDSDSDKSSTDDIVSDSNLLLTLFTTMLKKYKFNTLDTDNKNAIIFSIIHYFHSFLTGSYNLLIHIKDFGLIVVRDKYGIRPLSYAKKKDIYMFASEDCVYGNLNYEKIRDLNPGETIIYNHDTNQLIHHQYHKSHLAPCLFEYIYFAKSNSNLDGINVYQARQQMGAILGKIIEKKYQKIWCNGMSVFYNSSINIDMIVPVPETGRVFAYGAQSVLNKPIVEALVKNRYVDRTFIMENEGKIINNIHNKFDVVKDMVKGKNILLIDDSIVRGNTSRRINNLFRKAGVNKIYFASGCPRIFYPNHYGINIRTEKELVCYQNTDEQVAEAIGADQVIFNDLNMITTMLKKMNPKIESFETSIFNNVHLHKLFQ